jgi:methylenetetrahydrofolate dehydrogenase (NADP+)/methenyltetrahydrofolate cyclohydrolase
MSNILDGKLVASKVKEKVAFEVEKLKHKNINVCLAVILVGDDPASHVYVRNKKRACEEVGIISKEYVLSKNSTQETLLELVHNLNNDDSVHGILVQFPLPEGFYESEVIKAISPDKDVDAFSSVNVGKIMLNNYKFLPCTPAGIMEILKYYSIDVAGKECVVIGRSAIVGKPMSMLLLHADGTVTTTHSKTKNLKEITSRADILVAAIGKPNFVTSDMVKDGAVVIDVGINRVDGKLCGDVNFDSVINKASAITPVPGGVGPMTIAMLMQNTVVAAKIQNNI